MLVLKNLSNFPGACAVLAGSMGVSEMRLAEFICYFFDAHQHGTATVPWQNRVVRSLPDWSSSAMSRRKEITLLLAALSWAYQLGLRRSIKEACFSLSSRHQVLSPGDIGEAPARGKTGI